MTSQSQDNHPDIPSDLLHLSILNSLSDGIVALNAKGIILFANQSTAELLGYSTDALLGKQINQLIPGLEGQQLANYQMLGVSFESAAMHLDGHALPVELTINRAESLPTALFTVIIHDNSARKRIELFKHNMLSSINHQLRTPLTAIKGSLGVVVNGLAGELPEKAKQLIDIAHNNSERLLTTIETQLDPSLNEIEELTYYFESINLDELASEIIKENRPLCELNNMEILLSNHTSGITLFADYGRLLQAMHHLINSAIKASKRHKNIEIIIEERYGSIRFTVRDHGAGLNFPLSDLNNQTKQLELTVSKAIIEKHQGELKYRASTDEGNTFYFELPLHSQK